METRDLVDQQSDIHNHPQEGWDSKSIKTAMHDNGVWKANVDREGHPP